MAREKEEPKVIRKFWKTKRSLPAVVWDPSGGAKDQKTGVPGGRAKFEFVRNVCETTDPEVAELLTTMGYIEIDPETLEHAPKPPPEDLPDPDSIPLPGMQPKMAERELPPSLAALRGK